MAARREACGLMGTWVALPYHVLIMGQSRRWQDKKVRRRGKFVKSLACNHKELSFTAQATEVRNSSQHS